MKRCTRFYLLMFAMLVLAATGLRGHTPQSGATAPAHAVSETGLLPVYGIDFTFDENWVDAAAFPSQSAEHPNHGAAAPFQQIWDNLKPGGFNSIRFPVDVRETSAAANRVANLCVWAKHNNVHLIPVLVGADKGKAPGDEYGARVAAFTTALATNLRSAGAPSLEAYGQILAFQIERQMNHTGLHGPVSLDSAQQRVLHAAAALRQAEQHALRDTGLSATPILVTASFDHELIKLRAIAGSSLGDDVYSQAYSALQQFLLPLASSPDVDLIGVEWFPGSISAGGVDKLPTLVRSLGADLAGTQVVVTTGFATGFRSADEQKTFYSLAFANLADFRVSQGVDSPFLGVFFHEAVNGADATAEPPAPTLAAEMAQWDWAARADELVQLWNGTATSDAMTWWQKKVESTMGLLAVGGQANAAATVTPQPAQEGLTQIAATVTEATTAVEASAEKSAPAPLPSTPAEAGPLPQSAPSRGSAVASALMDKAQQSLMSVLDRVFQKLDNTIAGIGSGTATGGVMGGAATGGTTGGTASAGVVSIALTKNDVSVQPVSPRAGEPVRFTVTLRNQTADADASGLVVAIADQATNALAYASEVVIPRSSTQTLALTWTPTDPGTYPLSVQVYDAGLTVQLASATLDSVSVAAAAGANAGGSVAPGPESSGAAPTAAAVVNVAKQDVIVQTASPSAGAEVVFAITVRNQSADADASGLVVAVVDEASNALAYAMDVAVPRGAAQSVTVKWTPAAAGAYPLSVQVYDAGLTVQMAATSIELTVGPASDPTPVPGAGAAPVPGSGVPGTRPPPIPGVVPGKPGPITTIDVNTLGRIKQFSPKGKIPLAVKVGLVQIGSFTAGQQPLIAARMASMTVPVTNFSGLAIRDVTAKLLVDGKVQQSQKLGTILPGQERQVAFRQVAFARTGKQEIKVVFESGGAKPLSSSVARQVVVTDKPPSGTTPGVRSVLGGLRATKPAASTPASGPIVVTRPVVAPKLRVGRLAVPAAPASAGPATTKPAVPSTPAVTLPSPTSKTVTRPAPTTPPPPATNLEKERDKSPSRPQLTIPGPSEKPTVSKAAPRSAIATTVLLRPDLSVTPADVHCSAPAALTCTAVVRNLGKAPAENASVRFALDADGKDTKAGKTFFVDIGVGASSVVKWTVNPPPGQKLNVGVTVTASGDGNAGNNHATVAVGARPVIKMRSPR